MQSDTDPNRAERRRKLKQKTEKKASLNIRSTIRKKGKGGTAKAPYKELDPNIVKLVRVLNSFDGIQTIGSCGGHPDPKPYQRPEGSWGVVFRVEHSEDGWFALEFLTWFINNSMASSHRVRLSAQSAPPYLNTPGMTLYFALDGQDVEADWLAKELRLAKRGLYVSPADSEGWMSSLRT